MREGTGELCVDSVHRFLIDHYRKSLIYKEFLKVAPFNGNRVRP